MADKELGMSTSKMIGAIVALMIALLGISLALTLVKSITETTAVGSDSNTLENLRSGIWDKCNGISGEGASSTADINIEFDVKHADSVEKDGDRIVMYFPDSQSRDISLPDGCDVEFVDEELGSGNYDLSVSGNPDSDPPVVSVSRSSEESDSESDN